VRRTKLKTLRARNAIVAAFALQEARVPLCVATTEGGTPSLTALDYSPVRMATGSRLTRDAALEKIRARILAAARRGLDAADAEDLTQEALLLLTTKYAHVEAPEELVALGVRIVRLKRAALWRKTGRRRALGEAPPPLAGDSDALERVADPSPNDPESIARDRQRLRLFAEAAARLDGRCREMLRRKLEGLSFAEIAAALGRPVNTVYSWDYRCQRRLRKLLGERFAFVSGEGGR
jgi:RNA polymerase sigma factor (sigma-70 family)